MFSANQDIKRCQTFQFWKIYYKYERRL